MNATRDADMATPVCLSVHLSMTLILWSILYKASLKFLNRQIHQILTILNPSIDGQIYKYTASVRKLIILEQSAVMYVVSYTMFNCIWKISRSYEVM